VDLLIEGAGIAPTQTTVEIGLIEAIANLRVWNGLIDGLFIPIVNTGTANPILPLHLIATTIIPQTLIGLTARGGQNQQNQQNQQKGHNGAGQ
jgi:hypothetical protein